MKKTDIDGVLTKEYIDYVKGLEREDLERFYMGADLLNDDLQQRIERLNKKSEILEENNKLLIQQKSQLYEDLDAAYDRIDKAIEYIENCSGMYNNALGEKKEMVSSQNILEILKGEDNEI